MLAKNSLWDQDRHAQQTCQQWTEKGALAEITG